MIMAPGIHFLEPFGEVQSCLSDAADTILPGPTNFTIPGTNPIALGDRAWGDRHD